MSYVNGHATYLFSPISMLWETWLTHLAPNLTPPPPLAINIYGSRFLRLQMKGIFWLFYFFFDIDHNLSRGKYAIVINLRTCRTNDRGAETNVAKSLLNVCGSLGKKVTARFFTNILEEHHLSAHYFFLEKKKNPKNLDFRITVRKWISCYKLITVRVLNGTQRFFSFFLCFN